MALHPDFPSSPYAIPRPDQRWFPASEDLRKTAYEIFFNDPVLPANGFEGRNWSDDFQLTLHVQDNVRIVRPTGNLSLPTFTAFISATCPSRRWTTTT